MTDEVQGRVGTLTILRDSMSRDEFFAGLFILGCANGLGSRIIYSIGSVGWSDSLLSTFGISAIVWIACFAGIYLVLSNKSGRIRNADLIVGTGFLLLAAFPTGSASWFAVTALSIYVVSTADGSSSCQRGALILLATTVPMLWSRLLLFLFEKFILEIDASLVAWLLGTEQTGTIVRFADKSGMLVIYPPCSSLANISLAFLSWATITQWIQHRLLVGDLLWCFIACASVVAVNVIRISIMGLSQEHYELVHNQWVDTLINAIMVGITIGVCLIGVRRELFSRI